MFFISEKEQKCHGGEPDPPVLPCGADHQPPRPEPFVQSSVSASSPGMSRLSADAVPQAWTITPTTKQNGVGGGGLRRVSPSPSGASSNHSRIPIPASSRPSAGAAFRNSPNNGDSGRGGSSLGGVGGILASQDLATSQLASGSIISHPNQEPVCLLPMWKPHFQLALSGWFRSLRGSVVVCAFASFFHLETFTRVPAGQVDGICGREAVISLCS